MTRRPGTGQNVAALEHRRDIARQIDDREPRWEVMFGASSWLFWAFPAWPAPRGLILSDPDPAGLLAQMRQAEATYAKPDRRGGEAPAPRA